MLKKIFAVCVLGFFVVVAAQSWVEREQEIERIAQEYDFDAERTAAFKSCDDHMAGKRLEFPDLKVNKVPDQICICHSYEMTTVFKNGEYSSHGDFVDYVVDDRAGNPLKQTQIKEPMSAETGYERLVASLSRCLAEFYAG